MMVGSFRCSIDAKGRLYVPESFLRVLQIASHDEIGLSFSRFEDCIVGCGLDFAPHLILSKAIRTPIDDEGRVALPADWVRKLGITEIAILRGMGRTFQVWEPATLEQHEAETMKRLQEKRRQN